MKSALPILQSVPASSLADQAHALLEQQRQSWPMLRDGYNSRDTIQTRTFEFDQCIIKVQFNPGRITSSAAKVDPKSIRQRQCFLCPANLPPEQLGVPFERNYLVLCNPFPILPEHFTIPHVEHTPQQIVPSFDIMLRLARELSPRYTVFYNGPRCGASAPDHMHFQAGTRSFMPIEQELPRLKEQAPSLAASPNVSAVAVTNCLRKVIAIESSDHQALVCAFTTFHDAFERITGADSEPMMNILVTYDAPSWRVIIFPRGAHRPSFFFADADEKILLSPGAVDFGGVVITPIEQDFRRLNKQILTQMFAETTVSDDMFQRLVTELQ